MLMLQRNFVDWWVGGLVDWLTGGLVDWRDGMVQMGLPEHGGAGRRTGAVVQRSGLLYFVLSLLSCSRRPLAGLVLAAWSACAAHCGQPST